MAMPTVAARRTRRGGRGARAPMSEINVTPFVDVMLVLLIIFMITAPLLKAGVPIELPDSRAKALSEERRQVTISMRGDGALFIDDAAATMAELPALLEAMPFDEQDRPPLITLRADKSLDYGTVMAVMGELNRTGFTSISLVTRASVAAPEAMTASETPAGTEAAVPQESGAVVPDEPLSGGSGEEE